MFRCDLEYSSSNFGVPVQSVLKTCDMVCACVAYIFDPPDQIPHMRCVDFKWIYQTADKSHTFTDI